MFIFPLPAQGQGTRGTYINVTLRVQDFRGVHLEETLFLRFFFVAGQTWSLVLGWYFQIDLMAHISFRQNYHQ